ncbi:MAG: response regulator transcription factor [bacterium]|nr:response regulator transcription factor [bacterium]
MTLQAIIVDDEELARQRIKDLLAERSDIRVQAECRNGRTAIDAIRRHHPDLVFLDVQMPDVDGFGVIESIGSEKMPPVIFVTAFDKYALHAFETNAVDYLLKPFDRERFQTAVNRMLERHDRLHLEDLDRGVHQLLEMAGAQERYADRLVVRSSGSIFFVKVDTIDWVEASRNYVKIHCGSEVHTMRETMARMDARLDPERFLRIHRSTLVNIDRIKKIEPGIGTESIVVLENGERLMVSRAYRRGKVKELLS